MDFFTSEKLILVIGSILGITGTTIVVSLKDKIKKITTSSVNYIFSTLNKEFTYKRFEKRYLKSINTQNKYIKVIGTWGKYIRNPKIEDVYISLDLFSNPVTAKEIINKSLNLVKNVSITLNDALKQHNKVVILGDPGTGKTTALSYLAYQLSSNMSSKKRHKLGACIPFLIPLRRITDSDSIFDAILDNTKSIIPKELLKDCPKDYLKSRLNSGKCVFLLDGMDEVHNDKEYRKISDLISDFSISYPDNKFVVTCRIASWMNLLSSDFILTFIRPFNWNDIKKFIESWHLAVMTGIIPELTHKNTEHKKKALEEAAIGANRKSRKLVLSLRKNDRIESLATSPIMLSLICLVHYRLGDLPQKRSVLYDECIRILLDAWDREEKNLEIENMPNLSEKEKILQEISFKMFSDGIREEKRGHIIKITEEILQQLNIDTDTKSLV